MKLAISRWFRCCNVYADTLTACASGAGTLIQEVKEIPYVFLYEYIKIYG
jgi:hypothetical protein